MKKIIPVVVIVFLIAGNVRTVQAGELNQYESDLVGRAGGQFEKDGVTYQADSAYVQELINYLSQDGVDLTAAQRDEAVAEMYANVESGIEEGYLIRVSGQEKEKLAEEKQDGMADKEGVNAKEDEKANTAEKDNKADMNQKGTIKNGKKPGSTGSDNTKKTEEKDEAVTASPEKPTDTTGEDLSKWIGKQPVTNTVTDKYNGKITITDEKGNSLMVVDTVIKNTGFNINRTVWVLSGMGIILGICIIAAYRWGFLS
ncbi:hypothetical protein Ana3638_03545 [Anaerocolumna sedimenticola]|uniref:Uncharacterized protein n=1 Tax=Anaerocolumna sedimenticola TaxID=2696063 RepID=A0A6P1TI37_9FIRM|nr:hypothetical protein [Anaerocolumna sedimenticola]QHQ59967.1 hypothetical protein Ana3638_03545 [Anaerocolumna sedimenticola]